MSDTEDPDRLNFIVGIIRRIDEINSIIAGVIDSHGQASVDLETREILRALRFNYDELQKALDSTDWDMMYRYSMQYAEYAEELGLRIGVTDILPFVEIANPIIGKANDIKITLLNGPLKFRPIAESAFEVQKQIFDVLDEVKHRKSEINDMLGEVSGNAVANDYAKHARRERVYADGLRALALLVMLWAAYILTSALSDIAKDDFDWKRMLFEIAVSFLLSVPAAYLAKESAKHRHEHQFHLQRSLDLVAISPFLASLSATEQNKIKAELAIKMFGGRETKLDENDFPLSHQKIIMELIKRVKVPDKKDGKKEDE